MLQRRWMLLLVVIWVLAVGAGMVSYYKLEGSAPTLALTPEPKMLGRHTAFTLISEDKRSGIKQISVELRQSGKKISLLSETYPSGTRKVERTIEVTPSQFDLSDGTATIRAESRDRSWRRAGNPNIVEVNVTIDTRPPIIEVLSRFHYVNQGGTGLVVYKVSEALIKSGVEVDDLWFPGYPVGNGGYLALFAIPHDAPVETHIALSAEDVAQNSSNVKFPYRIRPKAFRTDKVQVSDGFLQRVIPYFTDRDSSLEGDFIEIFKKVNGDLRRANEQTVSELCQQTVPQPIWSGPFLRLAGSKTMSQFADRRIYLYGGKEIDRQVHFGVDLASVAMSSVEASNRGTVAYSGELGIYGNTVMLSHGCGLFSMYGHLSRIDVQPGQTVEKGEAIGTTGSTGLAGGDHLHFSILVSGVYVNPVEWWDTHWVEDNISSKLAELGLFEVSDEQQSQSGELGGPNPSTSQQ